MIRAKREPAGVGRKAFEPQDYQPVNDHAPGDRRNAVEHIGKKAEDRVEPRRAVFRQINSAQNANRYSNDTSNSEQFE